MIDLEDEAQKEERREKEQDMEVLRNHVAQLRERFDTIQIFCSRKQTGDKGSGTIVADMGAGNWYARFGQVKLWVKREEANEVSYIQRDDEG